MYKVRMLCHKSLQPTLCREITTELQQNHHQHDTVNTRSNTIPKLPSDRNSVTTQLIRHVVQYHLSVALAKRRAIGLHIRGQTKNTNTRNDHPTTDTFRWVNGEGDGLSGLAIDILQGGNIAVVMSSASWVQHYQEAITIAIQKVLLHQLLQQHLQNEQVAAMDQTHHMSSSSSSTTYDSVQVIWKSTQSRLQQDGYEFPSPNDGTWLEPDPIPQHETQRVICRENGILYATYPFADGQKTGVYCDQRDNRLMVAKHCYNKRVLDLCTYHGGFALNALLNGNARYVTAVDSSANAIAALQENAQLNEIPTTQLECIQSDITRFLQTECHGSNSEERQYDVVILDPPKLAPSMAALEKGRRKYHGLNRDAIKVINQRAGGLLCTCTCSAAMTQKEGGQYFVNMVHAAAMAAQRQVTLLQVSGAAPCHVESPIAWPAGSYLTAALFYVHPIESN